MESGVANSEDARTEFEAELDEETEEAEEEFADPAPIADWTPAPTVDPDPDPDSAEDVEEDPPEMPIAVAWRPMEATEPEEPEEEMGVVLLAPKDTFGV
jgi:hypothetical protein